MTITDKQASTIMKELQYSYDLPVAGFREQVLAGWDRETASRFISLLNDGPTGHAEIVGFIQATRS